MSKTTNPLSSERQSLDSRCFPLRGSSLIEASAGTGKTYTIALLYVRLVLGHGGETAGFGRPLLPTEILVVTFTDAAAQELRDRIRKRLQQAANVFAGIDPLEKTDPLSEIINDFSVDDYQQCAALLQVALSWMDDAAIFTIHAWCFRMLREHAFDSRHLFTQDLLANQHELQMEVVCDYWRQHFYAFDNNALAETLLDKKLSDPDALFQKIKPLLGQDFSAVVYANEPLVAEDPFAALEHYVDVVQSHAILLKEWQQALDQREHAICQLWREESATLEALLSEALWSGLNATKHGSRCDFFEAMNAWVNSTDGKPKKLGNFAAGAFVFKKNNTVAEPEHEFFDQIARLVEVLNNKPGKVSPGDIDKLIAQLLLHAARWVSAEIENRLEQRAELGYDDMLRRLLNALTQQVDDCGERLKAVIRQQFPVVMIDEFQDTDPVQYGIFDAVYRVAENDQQTALVMIGDPKQAIYAFRGGDIYTYLAARHQTTGRHYTLDSNYRSTEAMVSAVNTFFSSAENWPQGAFRFKQPAAQDGETVFNPVPFVPVASKGSSTRFLINGAEQTPLTFWNMPVVDESLPNKDSYRDHLADASASEIVRWLEQAKAGATGFETASGFSALKPRDIAILVSDYSEANAIRQALSIRGIKSVYLSDRESVFSSAEAQDVLRLVKAMAAPGDDRALKRAIVSPCLSLSIPALRELLDDENAWEQTVMRFRQYHDIWNRQGILPALRRLFADYQLAQQCMSDTGNANGERMLTNLLHLSEWLQQASQSTEGHQALIRCLEDEIRSPGEEQLIRLESDDDLIRVITIHKSKGLEYPLVLVPFAAIYKTAGRNGNFVTFHDRDDKGHYAKKIEIAGSAKRGSNATLQAAEEQSAEGVRLLYVAMTRAKHALWLGVATFSSYSKPVLHETALGYLLSAGEMLDSAALETTLNRLATASAKAGNAVITAEACPVISSSVYLEEKGASRQPPRSIEVAVVKQPWWVASYSALKTGELSSDGENAVAAIDQPEPEHARQDTAYEESLVEGTFQTNKVVTSSSLSIHDFPRGPKPGTFLHSLLEWVAVQGFAETPQTKSAREQFVRQSCARKGWQNWSEVLNQWISNLLTTPLPIASESGSTSGTSQTLRLDQLEACYPEMEFWFSSHQVSTGALDPCVRELTLGGVDRPLLLENTLNGLVKGFIDLVVHYRGRYFVLDWKSNCLGDSDAAYTAEAMQHAILEKRYELQYTLYLLALHRHLRDRLPDYDYERDVGGALYIFLRGINNTETRGVHFEKPPYALIRKLDALFASSEAGVSV